MTVLPRGSEIGNNGCVKFWGVNKVHYGLGENGNLPKPAAAIDFYFLWLSEKRYPTTLPLWLCKKLGSC